MTWLALGRVGIVLEAGTLEAKLADQLIDPFGGPAWIERGLRVAQVLQRHPDLAEPLLGPAELAWAFSIASRVARVDIELTSRSLADTTALAILRASSGANALTWMVMIPGRVFDVRLDLPAPVS